MNIQKFDYSVDLLQAILWQYNDAETLQSLLQTKQDWYTQNQQEFWTDWYNDVFNMATANDFGLAVWSIILGMPLFISPHPDVPSKPRWGFGTNNKNFERGNFSNANTDIFLPIEDKRILLRLRYFQLTTRGAVLEINAFLAYLFGPGMMHVIDDLDMTMTYVINVPLDQTLLQALQKYDVLPRPAGVGLRIVDVTHPTWGFEQFNQNFENGNFFPM